MAPVLYYAARSGYYNRFLAILFSFPRYAANQDIAFQRFLFSYLSPITESAKVCHLIDEYVSFLLESYPHQIPFLHPPRTPHYFHEIVFLLTLIQKRASHVIPHLNNYAATAAQYALDAPPLWLNHVRLYLPIMPSSIVSAMLTEQEQAFLRRISYTEAEGWKGKQKDVTYRNEEYKEIEIAKKFMGILYGHNTEDHLTKEQSAFLMHLLEAMKKEPDNIVLYAAQIYDPEEGYKWLMFEDKQYTQRAVHSHSGWFVPQGVLLFQEISHLKEYLDYYYTYRLDKKSIIAFDVLMKRKHLRYFNFHNKFYYHISTHQEIFAKHAPRALTPVETYVLSSFV